MKFDSPSTISAIAADLRLNAASVIVTICGDVVLPRGGELCTGTLIDLGARVGNNESLVRTAVSRLVGASQLVGARLGRHSYYRLAPSAIAAFMEAADLLYGADRPANRWQLIHDPNLRPEDARRRRMGQMDGSIFIRPDRGQPIPPGALAFRAQAMPPSPSLAGSGGLTALREGYVRFLDLFVPLQSEDIRKVAEADALVLRLPPTALSPCIAKAPKGCFRWKQRLHCGV